MCNDDRIPLSESNVRTAHDKQDVFYIHVEKINSLKSSPIRRAFNAQRYWSDDYHLDNQNCLFRG